MSHPTALEYSHSTKQYSGELAATALVLSAVIRYLEHPNRRESLLLTATFASALTFAYPAVFLLPGVLLAVSVTVRRHALWLSGAAASVLLVLWGLFIRPNTAPELAGFWAASADALFTPGLILAMLFVLSRALSLTVHSFRRAPGLREWTQIICALPLLLLAVASLAHWYPATQRMRLWVLPCFVLLLVMYTEDLSRRLFAGERTRGALALTVAVLFAAINIRGQIQEHRNTAEEDVSGAFHYLKDHAQPSDLLLVHAAAREGFRLYSTMEGWDGPVPKFGSTGWPCCARGKNALPGISTRQAVIKDLDSLIPTPFSGRIWLLYPTRPSHWKYTGLNEGDVWRSRVWEQGCPPYGYIAFKNIAVSPMNCRAGTPPAAP